MEIECHLTSLWEAVYLVYSQIMTHSFDKVQGVPKFNFKISIITLVFFYNLIRKIFSQLEVDIERCFKQRLKALR